MNDHELIVTNNNNVETETTSDEFDLFDFNTEGFGTVVMPNGEKSVVNIADFEAALSPGIWYGLDAKRREMGGKYCTL